MAQAAIRENAKNRTPLPFSSFPTLVDGSTRGIALRLQGYKYHEPINGWIISDPKMKKLVEIITQIAPTDINILIHGATGTGKEMVSRAIHEFSQRFAKPYVVVDCCALSPEIEDSELFGHAQGSFTGALSTRIGLLEQANKGTVFIDEVSEPNRIQQGKLLRFIETKTIRRVGTSKYIDLDVRIIAATNKDLARMVAEGKFREDLYHRLYGVKIKVPRLSERPEDIKVLSAYFLNAVNIDRVFPRFFDIINGHCWEGNVRELKQTLDRAAILWRCENYLSAIELEDRIITHAPEQEDKKEMKLREVIKNHIQKVIDQHGGCQKTAARDLGISERVLSYKKHQLGLLGSRDL